MLYIIYITRFSSFEFYTHFIHTNRTINIIVQIKLVSKLIPLSDCRYFHSHIINATISNKSNAVSSTKNRTVIIIIIIITKIYIAHIPDSNINHQIESEVQLIIYYTKKMLKLNKLSWIAQQKSG